MPDLWFFVVLLAFGAVCFVLGRQSVAYPIEDRETAPCVKRDAERDRQHGNGLVTYPARKFTAPPPPSMRRST